MCGGGIALTYAGRLDERRRLGAEVVDMCHLRAGTEDLGNLPAHADLFTSPAPDGELAHMATALQPDRAQVVVELLHRCRSVHLQMQPVVAVVFPLHLKMDQRHSRSRALVRRRD